MRIVFQCNKNKLTIYGSHTLSRPKCYSLLVKYGRAIQLDANLHFAEPCLLPALTIELFLVLICSIDSLKLSVGTNAEGSYVTYMKAKQNPRNFLDIPHTYDHISVNHNKEKRGTQHREPFSAKFLRSVLRVGLL